MRVQVPSHDTFVEFPDDTPVETIRRVMEQHFSGTSSTGAAEKAGAARVSSEDEQESQKMKAMRKKLRRSKAPLAEKKFMLRKYRRGNAQG